MPDKKNEKNYPSNFIRTIIENDLASGKCKKVVTRFPPEPNGYLHIGHAKSICLNFGLARDYGGVCHLRFDDTNPTKEDVEYVESIMEDVHWLGFDWQDKLFYASDYFDQLYEYAEMLIKDGKAYVCDLSQEEIRATRGTLTVPGTESPYRNRSVEENLDLFRRMKAGEFEEGSRCLRAKIDMASPNVNMRDPVIYRIRKAEHHRTGNKWVIYPMYDYTHCISDAIEGITHSLCTLEFEDHRPLYDWFLDQLPVPCHPQQIEFARLNLSYTVMSKRKLLELVQSGTVRGWDDPRMPTLAGMRRRGFTPEAIRDFVDRIGVAKADSLVDFELLQFCVREDLNKKANRVMAVLHPLKVTIENYPEDQVEEFEAINNPEDESAGTRMVPFCKYLYIEQDDFSENPPKGWHRLSPGAEVRLKHAYYITCKEVIKDESGNVTELICTYDPSSRGGWTPDARKVKGTIHWVSARHSFDAEIRLYENLFTIPNINDIEEGKDYRDYLNPNSIKVLKNCKLEPSLKEVTIGEKFQFLRQGYFSVDYDSTADNLVFNLIVTLKDSWTKQLKKMGYV
ncbi:MAG TPA: glutamine--tRNA ligase/YqeY domain fusion protein [Candidatus Syntrophosphaera thermopropionivorans]|jgi:glutaminyl-tRNA synthetase|nr:glutamine--tRNA ligase/YqeY domain fusion protein [Candidatus Syntrophosphaera thermopropionivorans]HON32404.1 glutamine--tRNA ligase/YqeY domain fusion protein [Candidatus Syntrophosphaera thermopropionivorans]HOQ83339.1 glutamine--tRNA ligase/YqeY domain fusion protein [Candidatus Syntrophosphaera thermopropionivorans]HPX63058.1 glutamine--tRNA ligase/YqeY domain fusion protein [Candidatus Syntrophosphaera thermopropionivorans]HQC58132.1 glutamine--tRNA ligase/YqeY domain fusion protein [C